MRPMGDAAAADRADLHDHFRRLEAVEEQVEDVRKTQAQHGANLANLVHAQHNLLAELQAIKRLLDPPPPGSSLTDEQMIGAAADALGATIVNVNGDGS